MHMLNNKQEYWRVKRFLHFPVSPYPILFFTLLFLLNGCMMTGMHGRKYTALQKNKPVKSLSLEEHLDVMIDRAVTSLIQARLPEKTIAVWDIQSAESGIDTEVVKQKIIDRLVKARQFKVLSRDALQTLLQEQSLSLSGATDSTQNTRIGKLLGVEGFLEGYVSKNGLFLKLINSGSGEIAWSFTTNEAL